MAEHERDGVRVRRPYVQEMEAQPVDRGPELRPLGQLALEPSPVVAVGPVVGQPAQLRARDALHPARGGRRLGPARVLDPAPKIIELGLLDGDGEGLDHRSILPEASDNTGTDARVLRQYNVKP